MKFKLFDDVPLHKGNFQEPQEALTLLFERTIQLEKWQDQLMSMMGLPEKKKERVIEQVSESIEGLLFQVQEESQFIFRELYPEDQYRPHLEQYVLTLQQTLEMMNRVYKHSEQNQHLS